MHACDRLCTSESVSISRCVHQSMCLPPECHTLASAYFRANKRLVDVTIQDALHQPEYNELQLPRTLLCPRCLGRAVGGRGGYILRLAILTNMFKKHPGLFPISLTYVSWSYSNLQLPKQYVIPHQLLSVHFQIFTDLHLLSVSCQLQIKNVTPLLKYFLALVIPCHVTFSNSKIALYPLSLPTHILEGNFLCTIYHLLPLSKSLSPPFRSFLEDCFFD